MHDVGIQFEHFFQITEGHNLSEDRIRFEKQYLI